MTRELDFDRTLEDWLAEGPSQLPDHAIDGIVRQLDETPQRKHWWLPGRGGVNLLVPTLAGAAATGVVALFALGIYFGNPSGVGGPPVSSPAPIPSASPTDQQSPASTASPELEGRLFESERYGYALRLPDSEWLVVERRGEWGLGTTFDQDGPGIDSLLRPRLADYPFEVYLNSQLLPEDTTFDAWLSQYDELQRETFPHCVTEGESGSAAVDGEIARVGTVLCDEDGDQWFVTESLWQHGQRVYSLRVAEGHDWSLELDTAAESELWLSRITHSD